MTLGHRGLGTFNALSFFLIDAADVGAKFSIKVGDTLYLAGARRQRADARTATSSWSPSCSTGGRHAERQALQRPAERRLRGRRRDGRACRTGAGAAGGGAARLRPPRPRRAAPPARRRGDSEAPGPAGGARAARRARFDRRGAPVAGPVARSDSAAGSRGPRLAADDPARPGRPTLAIWAGAWPPVHGRWFVHGCTWWRKCPCPVPASPAPHDAAPRRLRGRRREMRHLHASTGCCSSPASAPRAPARSCISSPRPS